MRALESPKPTKSGSGGKSWNLTHFRWILGTNPRQICHFRSKNWKVRKKLHESYKNDSKRSMMSKETRKPQNHQNLPKSCLFFFLSLGIARNPTTWQMSVSYRSNLSTVFEISSCVLRWNFFTVGLHNKI